MKILTVVGARPQLIKAAVVSRQLSSLSNVSEILVHTGQHFDVRMSDVFFKELQIPEPKYNLSINDLSHGAMTGRMLEAIENILLSEKPDTVLVYGDTNSTLAGALAARKQNIRLAHVEAGLRSFNMAMPEEVNRIVTDRISDLLFCPTIKSLDNLKREGFDHFDVRVIHSGDVMFDAVLYFAAHVHVHPFVSEKRLESYAICTVHRQENTTPENLSVIIGSLNDIHGYLPVIMPVHPRTRKLIESEKIPVRFFLIQPATYMEMMSLLKHCRVVFTDSGGLQKEAYFMRKPCITLRNETEWTELVEAGCNFLAGCDKQKILSTFDSVMKKSFRFDVPFYGDGKAGEKIASVLAG